MTIYGTVLPGAVGIARSAFLAGNLSAKAKGRLKVLDWHRTHGENISLTARRFGVHRRLLRNWRDRLKRMGPRGLEDLSKRPRRVRRPTTSPETTLAIVALRKIHPAWSKHKIVVLLKKNGVIVSASTVGRVLKRRGLIDVKKSMRRKRAALHPRMRFPRGMKISSPGDMVQMDTKHVMLPGGKRHYQFTAIDVLTKRRILELYPSESSKNGKAFLMLCLKQFPFPVKAVQTDNGSPFLKKFMEACEEIVLPHYLTHPRTPKENTYVEISHGCDKREFYAQGNIFINFNVMKAKLKQWEKVWNEVRPHQALNYLTPNEYYEKWEHDRLPTKDVITLQT